MVKAYYETSQDMQVENAISVQGATVYHSHFHYKTEITYVEEGFVRSVINGKDYSAEKDEILFVPEYYPHSYETSPDARRMVLLPTNNLKGDFDKITAKTFPCLLTDKKFNEEKILPVLHELYKVQQSDISGEAKFLLCKAYVGLVYGNFLARYDSEMTQRDQKNEIIADVLAYIEQNYKENVTLPSIAQRFGYNKFYFSKLFNAAMGESLCSYVNSVRVRKFTELYKTKKNANVLSIAFSVGFDSMPSFYRAFKNVYKVTPVQYFANESQVPFSR